MQFEVQCTVENNAHLSVSQPNIASTVFTVSDYYFHRQKQQQKCHAFYDP